MPGQAISHFDIMNCTASAWDQDGWLGCQVDAEGSEASSAQDDATPGQGGVRDFENVNPGGVFHRPLDPVVDASGTVDATQAGQLFVFMEGGRGFAMPLGDPRAIAILPTFAPGSTLLYADNGSFVRLEGSGPAVGQISIYTTDDGTPDGYTVGINVWPEEIRFIPPGGGRCWMDVSGYHWIDGGSGGFMNLGTNSGQAGWDVMCDQATIDAQYVNLGRKGALGRGPVMRGDLWQSIYAVPLSSALTLIGGAIAALAAAPAATGSPPAGVAALIPPMQAALAALKALSGPIVGPLNSYVCTGTFVA
jgi:hypothetical protein